MSIFFCTSVSQLWILFKNARFLDSSRWFDIIYLIWLFVILLPDYIATDNRDYMYIFISHFTAAVVVEVITGCLHGTIVGPTGRSDWSVRLVGPTIVSCKHFVRPVGQTVDSKNQTCLISSDCRSDCRSVWTLRPTGRTDWPVGRPITL